MSRNVAVALVVAFGCWLVGCGGGARPQTVAGAERPEEMLAPQSEESDVADDAGADMASPDIAMLPLDPHVDRDAATNLAVTPAEAPVTRVTVDNDAAVRWGGPWYRRTGKAPYWGLDGDMHLCWTSMNGVTLGGTGAMYKGPSGTDWSRRVYDFLVYVPTEIGTTRRVTYQLKCWLPTAMGDKACVLKFTPVDQRARAGSWTFLGTEYCYNQPYVCIDNGTGENGRQIAFDQVRFAAYRIGYRPAEWAEKFNAVRRAYADVAGGLPFGQKDMCLRVVSYWSRLAVKGSHGSASSVFSYFNDRGLVDGKGLSPSQRGTIPAGAWVFYSTYPPYYHVAIKGGGNDILHEIGYYPRLSDITKFETSKYLGWVHWRIVWRHSDPFNIARP